MGLDQSAPQSYLNRIVRGVQPAQRASRVNQRYRIKLLHHVIFRSRLPRAAPRIHLFFFHGPLPFSSPARRISSASPPRLRLRNPAVHCSLYVCTSAQMTTGRMRRLFSSSTRTQLPLRSSSSHLTAPRLLCLRQYQRTITDVRPRQASVAKSWFTSSTPSSCPQPGASDHPPPDERTLKLGNSMQHPVFPRSSC